MTSTCDEIADLDVDAALDVLEPSERIRGAFERRATSATEP